MAAVPHPRIWYRLEALEEALARQERRLEELVERQRALKGGLLELKQALVPAAPSAGQPAPPAPALTSAPPKTAPTPAALPPAEPALPPAEPGKPGAPADDNLPAAGADPPDPAPAPLVRVLGLLGRENVRRGIIEGTFSNGIQEIMGWLQQFEEFLDGLLKILEQVRNNLGQPGASTMAAEIPVLSRHSVEVMAKMIKMPEFQRLAAGLLTQMLRDQGPRCQQEPTGGAGHTLKV
ncbi:MAG: hypothetical protein QHH27_11030 [Clostridia bacterium]|jgi:hypothetical protein|nr:hypothetical protein [Clostridia bacterium]MDH7574053.1 hypothetical protein [Clostridia bacterium]